MEKVYGKFAYIIGQYIKNKFSKISTRYPARQGILGITFDPEHRNERFTVISFMGFPAILSTFQSFEICIFNRK